MQESMYKFMKVGLIHFMAYPQVIKGCKSKRKSKKTIGSESFSRCLWCSATIIDW